MALTVSLNRPNYAGDRKVASGTITFDSSYATGGESLTAADLGLASVEVFLHDNAVDTTPLVVTPKYDYTNSKLMAFYVDNNGAADSGQIQVPNTTDLSLYTLRFVAFGK